MYDRLTGTPPSPALLDDLEARVATDKVARRAVHAWTRRRRTRARSTASTLKNFATPWTNRDQTVFAPLNDYTATVIGMVRDDVDFRGILSDDIVYVGQGIIAGVLDDQQRALRGAGEQQRRPARRAAGDHAVLAERPAAGGDRRHHHFARRLRSVLHRRHEPRDVPLHAAQPPVPRHGAGARHVASAGSHPPGRDAQPGRRQHACSSTTASAATAAWTRWRRRSRTTTSTRRRCRLVYTQGQVQPKYLINSDNFKPGYVTPDDHWENRWRLPGKNTLLGWAGAGRPDPQRQRREVARPGAGEQRCVRAVPGREGVPHGVLPLAERRAPIATRSTASVPRVSRQRRQPEAACSPRPPRTARELRRQ